MSNRSRAFIVILLASAFMLLPALRRTGCAPLPGERKRPLRCTEKALAVLKPVPKLEYECEEQDEDSLKSEERRAALKDYLREIEDTFNDAGWWAMPVKELNACSISREARALKADESQFIEEKIDLYGDQATRLVTLIDPCVMYSYRTLNAYILQRVDERVYAMQVLDAFYTRFDAAVDMQVTHLNGERLIMVEKHAYDGGPVTPVATTAFYTISPRMHRAVLKRIFKEKGKLTNELVWEMPPFFDPNARDVPSEGWRPPAFEHNGTMSTRFFVYYPTRRGIRHQTYTWNGRYYELAR